MSCNHNQHSFTRRQALRQLGGGFGMVAFANLIQDSLKAAESATPPGVQIQEFV